MESEFINKALEISDVDSSIIPDENEQDLTVHGFNLSSINNTVIEKTELGPECKHNSCEGSDSGVEVIENVECILERAISTNSQDFETIPSVQSDSSLISCYSNYDEAYNLLVRRNSTLLDDYKLRNVDGTSENGSESSSVASTKVSKRLTTGCIKKKVTLESKRTTTLTPGTSRSRSKPPPINNKPTTPSRTKSVERTVNKIPKSNIKTRTKPVPDSLNVNIKRDVKKNLLRSTSTTKATLTTPTDDGRWPSNNCKPSPLMTRSLKGILPFDASKIRTQPSLSEAKNTLEKYATLPRRRKERSADNISDLQEKTKPKSRDNSVNRVNVIKKQNSRENTPIKNLPPVSKKKIITKTKIYHETGIQTVLDLEDIKKALSGIHFNPVNPQDAEKKNQNIQVDTYTEEVEKLQDQLSSLMKKHEALKQEHSVQATRLCEAEQKLRDEQIEKDGIREELKQNNERVFAMLGVDGTSTSDDTETSDSLMVLENRFQNASQVIIKQEQEISKLNAYCRALQRDFDKSILNQNILLQQQQELQAESVELQEFLQMEKTTLSDALKESELEIKRNKLLLVQKEKECDNKQEECKHLVRIHEQKRQEKMSLQARYASLEAKCRELLIHQGSAVSGAAVALSALISRLDGLVDELISSYSISEQELDDVIYHNEAYSNSSSSPDATPDKSSKFIIDKMPSPKRGSSFVSAVINAIKNATAQSPFIANRENSKDNITDNSDSTELLDSETEPCLMMEHVLEDVVVPDGHTHNMISSGHSMISSLRLTHSESLNSLPQVIASRQALNTDVTTSNLTTLTDLCSSVSLVDQVIDVDNLVTRLLKVIRIIQIENEDYINELQDEKDNYCGQVNAQRDTNKIVVKQLKDWEILGAKLKSEVKDLLQQLNKKNTENEDVRNDLNQQRKEVEKLNEDVCNLSTALSKSELDTKIKEEKVLDSLKKWEADGDVPISDIMGRIILIHDEVPVLKSKLQIKENQLNELTKEYIMNKQMLSDHLKDAVCEAKKQYVAIDNALEILHSIQCVVQQCPQLIQLQHELEERSFQSASAMPLVVPPDCNANAALLQAMANLDIVPINTSA